jgi:hypothetical protein
LATQQRLCCRSATFLECCWLASAGGRYVMLALDSIFIPRQINVAVADAAADAAATAVATAAVDTMLKQPYNRPMRI